MTIASPLEMSSNDDVLVLRHARFAQLFVSLIGRAFLLSILIPLVALTGFLLLVDSF